MKTFGRGLKVIVKITIVIFKFDRNLHNFPKQSTVLHQDESGVLI